MFAKMNGFSINGRMIGANYAPYIIAEMSGNHNNSYAQAEAIVRSACRCGVDAIKFQTYTANTITLDSNEPDFQINNPSSLWDGKNLHELYSEAATDWTWIKTLSELSNKIGLTSFASVFDESSVEFMENLGVSAYKISSFENNHIPLINAVSATKKPLIISTGASTIDEIEEAVEAARSSGCSQLALLKCTSEYPADPQNTNLRSIEYLREKFSCEVGLSDHTLGIGVPIASVALGASIIEKHFTVNRDDGGIDSAFSSDEREMCELVVEAKKAHSAIGAPKIVLSKQEVLSRQFKRSIYASSDIKFGEQFTKDNIKVVRPNGGLHPRYYHKLLKKQASRSYKYADPILEQEL